jgi:signal transduction histidine kinase
MSAIGSPPKAALGAAWALFAAANSYLALAPPSNETLPFLLAWAGLALLSGMRPWPRRASIIVFALVTAVTGVALVRYVTAEALTWEQCGEVALMATTLSLLIWLIGRQGSAQIRLRALQRTAQLRLRASQQANRDLTEKRESVALFGCHEIRTRLTIARGYSQLIADQAAEPRVREDAARVVNELIKASALATNLLTLDRVMEPSTLEPVDVDRLLTDTLHRWSVTTDRAWSVRSAVGTVASNAVRLEVILDCLIENAIRFTGPGDTIEMVAAAPDNELVLTVRDTGDGIPAAELVTIFEIFRTASTAGELAGSGLGLAIVKATMATYGGNVSVASMLGQGTTFTLRFPVPVARPATRDGASSDLAADSSASITDREPALLSPRRPRRRQPRAAQAH